MIAVVLEVLEDVTNLDLIASLNRGLLSMRDTILNFDLIIKCLRGKHGLIDRLPESCGWRLFDFIKMRLL